MSGEPANAGRSGSDGGTGPVHHLNLRVGAASTDANGRPTLCLEAAPPWILSVEGCGTGQGFLHDEAGRELAHFRAKLAFDLGESEGEALRLRVGLGFAELQIGDDDPGFVFSRADPVETAGPEAPLSLQGLLALGRGFELVANLVAGLALLPRAGTLRVPQSEWQPFAGIEVGAGF